MLGYRKLHQRILLIIMPLCIICRFIKPNRSQVMLTVRILESYLSPAAKPTPPKFILVRPSANILYIVIPNPYRIARECVSMICMQYSVPLHTPFTLPCVECGFASPQPLVLSTSYPTIQSRYTEISEKVRWWFLPAVRSVCIVCAGTMVGTRVTSVFSEAHSAQRSRSEAKQRRLQHISRWR